EADLSLTCSCHTFMGDTSLPRARDVLDQSTPDGPLFHRDQVVCTFPAILAWPEESEDHLPPRRQRRSRQIQNIHLEPGIACVGVVRGLPVIDAPVHTCRREQDNAERFVPRD